MDNLRIQQNCLIALSRLHCMDGIASHLATLLPALRRQGWTPHVVVGLIDCPPENESRLEQIRAGCETFRHAPEIAGTCRMTPGRLWREGRVLSDAARRCDARVVHLHGRGLGPVAVALNALGGPPVVNTAHLGPAGARRGRLAWFGGRLIGHRVIAISSEMQDHLVEHWGAPRSSIRKVLHGVDLTRYRPATEEERAASRHELGIDDDEFVALQVGRIEPIKRWDTTLEAFAELHSEGRRCRLLLAGSATEEQGAQLRARIDRLGLGGVAHPLGTRDVVPLLWAADALTLPSEREGFPLVIVEAMACGVPPVRTPVEGARDQIDDGEDGLLFPVGDSAALAEKLRWLMDHPEESRRLGHRAAAKSQELFSDEAMARGTIAVYEELAGPRGGAEAMRVALVNHTFRPTDGQGHVNAQVAAALAEAGRRVTLVGRDVPAELASHPLVEVVPLGPIAWAPSNLARHVTFGWRSAGVIRRLRRDHDLILANGGMTFTRADVNLCHFVHASWLGSKRHPGRASGRRGAAWSAYQFAYAKQACWWERDAYHRAGRIIAVSELVRQQLIADVGIEAAKIEVIENGVDPAPEGSSREHARREIGAAPGEFVVAFAGDLKTPRKNFDVLLRALERLPDEVRVVAFGGHEGGPYPGMARELGLSDRVRFLGMRADVRELLAGADAFVLASHYEPFGLVVTEAMTSGVPVVTTRSVGASSVVERLEAGLVLADENDPVGLAEAIGSLRDHPAEAARYAANGQRVVEELSWSAIGKRYVSALECALEQRRNG